LLRCDGHIIDINPTPAKFARSALPGHYEAMIAQPVTEDLEEVARAAGQGTLRLPIARVVPLTETIAALTELELNRPPRGGKLITTPG
jgi:NADPH:quinone reductase-like Zn-dependent oxidoreductase